MTKKITATSLVGGVLMMTGTAFATPVEEIKINGNERVEDATVKSYLGLKIGSDYNPSDASSLIRTLYSTGLFKNVEVSWEGGSLSIDVEENPLVNKVVFEGNDVVDDEELEKLISMSPRDVFTPDKIQKDTREITGYYRQLGRFVAQVTPQIIERDQNRVDVIYKIAEGDVTDIESIRFVGNTKFSDGELKSVIRTKESRWFRFLTSSDVYDPERVEVDKELLRRHYIQAGYADFRVVSAVAELSKNKEEFFITITLSEGEPYEFGTVDVRVDSADEDINKDELREALEIQGGDRYNGLLVEKEMDKLVDLLGAKGFAFLDVRPVFRQDEAGRKIDLTFDVVPGPRVYVNRININGNTRTRDYVVRREMRFAEGDAFSTSKLKRSEDVLNYLGFFDKVEIERKETGDPDRVDLDVNVSEQSTGEFNIGAGFSTYEGALAMADIRERNFLGKGQDATLGFSISRRRQNFKFSFTEPYFLGRNLSAGFDAFNEKQDFQTESSYDTNRFGGGIRFGFKLSEYVSNVVSIRGEETDVVNVDSTASTFIQQNQGKRSAFRLGNVISKDTRDSSITPSKGYRLSLSAEYSGFGGDIDALKTTASGSWHKEMMDDVVLSFGTTIGGIAELGDDLPVFENFFSGGNQIRGFDFGGIGPRDATTNDALGGRYMLSNSAELSFPLGTSMKEAGVNGFVFADGGLVTEFRDDPNVIDSRKYRVSVGTGIYWKSPMGPLRFEFGFPVVKAKEDDTRVFNFSFGTRF